MKTTKRTKTAKFLKSAREDAGLSQYQLASALGYHGPQYISNIERELCVFPIAKTKLAAKALGIDGHKLAKMIVAANAEQMMAQAGY